MALLEGIMKGKILAYSADVGAGVVMLDDGRHRSFNIRQWHSNELPKSNMKVMLENGHNNITTVKPNS